MTDIIVGSPPDSVWGPACWSAMQALAFSYPVAADLNAPHRQAFFAFLQSLETLIPCRVCREHYAQWRKDTAYSSASPIFDNRRSLSEAIIALHNDVRRRQGKTEKTFEEVKEKYTGAKSSCPLGVQRTDSHSTVLLILVIILAISASAAIAVSALRKKK